MILIGDVHGADLKYKEIIDKHKDQKSIQLGDFGFHYNILKDIDSENHKILGGNHDNYDQIVDWPHYLGDYGIWNDVFFVRGAFSIDKYYRIPGISWWEQEELNETDCIDCLHTYAQAQPNIVVSHTPPSSVLNYLNLYYIISSRTGSLLSDMLETWRPKLWIFAHMHQSTKFSTTLDKELPPTTITLKGFNTTKFVALDELEIYNL